MYATSRSNSRGSTLIAVLAGVAVLGGVALMLVSSSTSANQEAQTRLEAIKAFYVAEGGLDLALSQLARDRYWVARDTTRFPTMTADGSFESAWLPLGSSGAEYKLECAHQTVQRVPGSWTGTGLPPGFERYANVTFTDRATGTPGFDVVSVRVRARYATSERALRARIRWRFDVFGAAIVSDALAEADTGNGVALAKYGRNVVVDGQNQHIFGGVLANGGIYVDHSTVPLTSDNAETEMTSFAGPVGAHLEGTPAEIVDFTLTDTPQQLFDFDRFHAAATAGAGETFGSLAAFATAMNAANTAGTPLEGIIYVTVNAASEGPRPKLAESGGVEIPGGINILGTLVFDFENVPSERFKLRLETPLNINPATLPADFDPADPTTFRSGYPPVIDPANDPRGYNIGSPTYQNFGVNDDLPALMSDGAALDVHDAVNISGIIYGPGYVEIENKRQALQFINGTVLSGGGVYLQGQNTSAQGPQVITLDRRTMDDLATFADQGKTPILDGFTVEY